MSDRPVPVKHALNNPKIRMSAPNPAAKGIYATLSWDIFQNNPRIVVDTKDPQFKNPENQYGRIQAAMDPVIAYSFLELLEWAIALDKPNKERIANYGANKQVPYQQGQRPEPVHVSDVWVGRDAEMNVFISVLSAKENWPKIKFVFGPSDHRFVKYFKADGTERSKEEISTLFAKAYLRLLSEALAGVLVKTYEHVQPSQFGGGNRNGGGGGGYNRNNNGGGRAAEPARESSSDDGDDMPF